MKDNRPVQDIGFARPRWLRSALAALACSAAFLCMEGVVWATYAALDGQAFDVRKAWLQPLATLARG